MRFTVVLLGALAFAPAGAAASTEEANVVEARTLFRDAASAADEGDWASARDKYARSLALKRSALTLYNLALSQKHCGELVSARDSLGAYLIEPQTEKSEALLSSAQGELRELAERIPRLSIMFDGEPPSGVEVRIDGVRVAVSRAALHSIDPGRRSVRVDVPGRPPFEREVELREREVMTVHVPVTPEPAPPEPVVVPRIEPKPPAPPAAPPKASPHVAPIVLMASGGAVALAGLSVGIAGFVKAQDPSIDAESAQSARLMGIAADVLVPAGVAASGVGLILIFVLPDEPAPSTAAPRAGAIRPRADGIVVTF